MSTVHVNDQLYQRAFEAAVAQGKSVEEFVRETIERAVGSGTSNGTAVQLAARNDLPVMIVGEGVPAMDLAKVRRALEEEGF